MMITLIFKPDQVLNVSPDIKLFHESQYFMVLVNCSVLGKIFQVLHFIQILQWFLSIFALGVCLYIADNLVVDEANTNDVHEIGSISNDEAALVQNDAASSISWSSNTRDQVQISFRNEVFEPSDYNDPIAIKNLPKY